MHRRINVDSGRPLESLAHYSRALRANDVVLQSGTTAIDREGNILGDDIASQIAAIVEIARESMAAAEGRFENLVRVRLYVVGENLLAQAVSEFLSHFEQTTFVLTTVAVSRLARPAQLIEIEFEAVDDAANSAHLIAAYPDNWRFGGTVPGVGMNDTVRLAGGSVSGQDAAGACRASLGLIHELLEDAGAVFEDLVSLEVLLLDLSDAASCLDALREALDGITPTITLLQVPGLLDGQARAQIEADAVIGASQRRIDVAHPHHRGFAANVAVGDQIYLSNVAPLDAMHKVIAPGDWAAQRDACCQILSDQLTAVGSTLDDVIVRRFYTRAAAEMNSQYGEGPGWFAASRPAALGCRIEAHSDEDSVLSLHAHAVRGAARDIEWRKLY